MGTGAVALSLPLRAWDPGAGAFLFMSALERQPRTGITGTLPRVVAAAAALWAAGFLMSAVLY